MRLPNGAAAVADIEKLRSYCLNVAHPEGRHKARMFRAILGMTEAHADLLRAALLDAAAACDASTAGADQYGQRFVIEFQLGHVGRSALVRSAWIVRTGENFPRLTSCYVLRGL